MVCRGVAARYPRGDDDRDADHPPARWATTRPIAAQRGRPGGSPPRSQARDRALPLPGERRQTLPVEADGRPPVLDGERAAQQRRGEATSIFFDDLPTFRYLAVLPYWLGRAQEGLKSPAATASYERFLTIRGSAASDPLVADAQRRVREPQ